MDQAGMIVNALRGLVGAEGGEGADGGMLEARQRYNAYKINVESNGGTSLDFNAWLAAGQPTG